MAPANPASPPQTMSSGAGNGSLQISASATSSTNPTTYAAVTTLEALARREARPPLKSPLPQHKEAARPKITVAKARLISYAPERSWYLSLKNLPSRKKAERPIFSETACEYKSQVGLATRAIASLPTMQ